MATTAATTTTKSVGVIGAGAAGLAVARVLSRVGIDVTVLERDREEGGVWNYVPSTSNDGECRPVYRGLRTNLPREVMQYREFPWRSDASSSSYATHEEVRRYLSDYADAFDLRDMIEYGCRVTDLSLVESDSDSDTDPAPPVSLSWERRADDDDEDATTHTRVFDSVCVCNGHYGAPSTPRVEGLKEHFDGRVAHSADYDDPADFAGLTVLCVGARASGADLAREISLAGAAHVYLSDSTCATVERHGNVTRLPRTNRVDEGGVFRFGRKEDGNERVADDVDVVLFCSGYDYEFPFASPDLGLFVVPGERRVGPLLHQLWHARVPGSLAFVGLPHSVVPFPLFELQAEAVAASLSTDPRTFFPPLATRLAEAERGRTGGGPDGGRVQDTHFLGNHQWDYCRLMAKLSGRGDDEDLERYVRTNKALYDHAGKERKACVPGGPDTYRETRYARDDEAGDFRVVRSAATIESRPETEVDPTTTTTTVA